MDLCVPVRARWGGEGLTSCKGDTGDVWPWVGEVTTVKADLLKGQEHQSRTWPHILHSVRQINPGRVSGSERGALTCSFLGQGFAVFVFISVSTCPSFHFTLSDSLPSPVCQIQLQVGHHQFLCVCVYVSGWAAHMLCCQSMFGGVCVHARVLQMDSLRFLPSWSGL